MPLKKQFRTLLSESEVKMIERYTRKEMGKIWSLESKFQHCLNVELAVLDAYAKLGQIESGIVKDIKAKASFTVEKIDQIEKTELAVDKMEHSFRVE